MSFLDQLLGGIKRILSGGTLLPAQPLLNFIGFTVADDPSNGQTNITAPTGFTAGGDLSGTSTSQTVIGFKGKLLDTSMASPSDAQLIVYSNSLGKWAAVSLSGGLTISATGVVTLATISMGGDVTGNTGASVVAKWLGVALDTGTLTSPASGAIPVFDNVSGKWKAGSGSGIFSPGGDLSGTATSQTVAKVNGATVGTAGGSLTTGKVLCVTGASAIDYGAVDLANSNAVTGVLPTGNQASQAMGGDVSGTTAAATVAKVNGSSVPAGGSLTTGTVLRATGASALGYGALDLANASAVTGILPKGNQANQDMVGDVTGNTGASVVAKVNGTSVPATPSAGSSLIATSTTAATWVDPYAGAAAMVLPLLMTHKVKWLNGETNAYNSSSPTAGVQYAGWSTLSFNGTTTPPSFASTSRLAGTKRLRFQATTATAFTGVQETGYVNAGVAQWGSWRGNGSNRGGFLWRCRFAITNIGVTSVLHCFIGILEAVQQQTSSFDYTTDTTTCKLGIGFTATTTAGGAFPSANWQGIESAHSSPHLTDLGSNFALTLNDFIEVIMYAAPNDTKVTLTVNNLTTGNTNTVTLNTNLPTNTVMMGTQIVLGTQSITSGTNAIDIANLYLEDFDG